MNTEISIKSKSRTEFINITAKVQNAVDKSGIRDGVCYIFTSYIYISLSL
jgi:thiamine phosphate synthase YjbQ (UPF0047 family)